MKRFLCILICLMMFVPGALAQGWMVGDDQPGAVDNVTEGLVYNAADEAGLVVNADQPMGGTEQEKIVYSFSPLEAVLIIDVSGSMASTNAATGKSLLDYAKDAADSFQRTLLSVNPASRVGVVQFDTAARVTSDLKGLSQQADLVDAIYGMDTAGTTNTGDGYNLACNMLENSTMPERRKVVLMITDGVTNEGVGDPISYAINQGKRAAGLGNVYTIGLVGGLSSGEKQSCRRVLSAGYETRYFEVDFEEVGDFGAMLNSVVSAIAVAVSSAETADGEVNVDIPTTYRLAAGSGFDVRVDHASGEYLSSSPEDYCQNAAFGSLSVVDGEKLIIMVEDDYDITIQGRGSEEGGYALESLEGVALKEVSLAKRDGWSHESIRDVISISQGQAQTNYLGYECLDVSALDFAGNPTRGLDMPATAIAKGSTYVRSAINGSSSVRVETMPMDGRVKVLAKDSASQRYLISMVDEKGLITRGWVLYTQVSEPESFVPEMIWLSGEYTLAQAVTAYRAPDFRAAEAAQVKAGTKVTLKHVERDEYGREWAYVDLKWNPTQYVYLPADCLEGWQPMAPEGFRLGYAYTPYFHEISMPKIGVQGNQKLRVFSGPDTSYWRGASNKALVNTNGGLYAMGWVDNDWLFVMYGTSVGNRRVGYVPCNELEGPYPEMPQVIFESMPATVNQEYMLTDDPENESEKITNLAAGTSVTYLASFEYNGRLWEYIETKAGGKRVRGFVPVGYLDFDQ